MNYRLILGILCSTIFGFFLHVELSGAIGSYVQRSMAGINVLQPPYPFWITAIAFVTAVLPVTAWAILFLFVYDRIPFENAVMKGLTFSSLILLLKGDLLRQQIMGYVVGNPFHVVLIQSLDPLLPNLLMGVILAISIRGLKISWHERRL
jgi:hypothetical protein